MTRSKPRFGLVMVLALAPLAAFSQDAVEQRMTITGDQELPSVLYVLPWRTPDLQPVLEPVLDNPALEPLGPCTRLPGPDQRPPGCEPNPERE